MEEHLHISVQLSPCSIQCSNFLEHEDDFVAKVKTAILAPIRISTKNGIIIAWQCSLAAPCQDNDCLYSRIVKQKQQEEY